jgi:N-acetylglucosaminyldiphosphoundecaprenol N-acetyl-beta-D-mannosaminyltransferase
MDRVPHCGAFETANGTLSDHRHDILRLPLDILTPQRIVERFVQLATAGRPAYCCVSNVHQCVLAHDDALHRQIVCGAAMVVSDSTILQRAVAWRLGIHIHPPLRGAELMLEICREAEARGIPIALVGGRNPDALTRLIRRLSEDFPRLTVAHAHSPAFGPADEADERAKITALRVSGARIVFVGLGCPKQERWMAKHSPSIDAALIGVGAAFDANAGIVKSSPRWVHSAGLDWLHRLASEPRRLWRRYLTTSPRFLWLLLTERRSPH